MKRLGKVMLLGFWVVLSSALFLLPSRSMALEPGLYFSDPGQGIIFKMNLEDRSFSAFYSIQDPNFLEQDGEGNLVASLWNGRPGQIIRVSTDGDFIETIASELHGNSDIAFDSSGYLYVAESNNSRILRIAPSGGIEVIAVGVDYPVGLEFDSEGAL